MKNDFVYLTIHQGFALVAGIEELKKNPYFKDPISESFIQDVFKKSTEITVNSLNYRTNLIQKCKKNGNKIEVSRSKFEYIKRLTGIDVFDEDFINEYMSKLNENKSISDGNKPKTR